MTAKTPSSARVRMVPKQRWTISGPAYQRVAGLKFVEKRQGNKASTSDFAGLDLHKAVRVLLAQTGHPLIRQVLAAGLCARVLQPGNSGSEKKAMLIEVASVLAQLERKFLSTGNVHAFSRVQSHPLVQAVFAQLFYPMGGSTALIDACRSSGKQNALRESAIRDLEYLVNTVMVLHAYLEKEQPGYAQSDKTHIVEMERLRRIIAEMGLREIGPVHGRVKTRKDLTIDQVRNYWKVHARYLPLAYAAFRTPYPKYGNLLAAIFADRATGPKLASVAADWLRRAEYARKAILEKINFGHRQTKKQAQDGTSVRPRFVAFKDVKQLEVAPPKYSPKQLALITSTIGAPRGSRGKKLTPRRAEKRLLPSPPMLSVES